MSWRVFERMYYNSISIFSRNDLSIRVHAFTIWNNWNFCCREKIQNLFFMSTSWRFPLFLFNTCSDDFYVFFFATFSIWSRYVYETKSKYILWQSSSKLCYLSNLNGSWVRRNPPTPYDDVLVSQRATFVLKNDLLFIPLNLHEQISYIYIYMTISVPRIFVIVRIVCEFYSNKKRWRIMK